jgi:hypothetical protein
MAARRQLELIEVTRRYFSEVRELLRAGPRLEAG